MFEDIAISDTSSRPSGSSGKVARFSLLLLFLFWPVTALVLWLDSLAIARTSDFGQTWANLIAPVFLLLLMTRLKPQRQLMVALFVPLSAVGEAIFSLALGLYEYRLGSIPLYVPFGHSILMSVGLMLADTDFVQANQRRVQTALIGLHGSLIAGTLLFFQDTLSTLFAAIYLIIFRKNAFRPFYLILGVLVLYVEMLGTIWGVWYWRPDVFGVLHTINPPTGAFTCYVMGDLLAIKIALHVETLWKRRRNRIAVGQYEPEV